MKLNIELPSIYLIRNKINNKVYIGSTINLRRRISDHLLNGDASNIHLQNSIKYYGIENFTFEVLEFLSSDNLDLLLKMLTEKEQYYIDLYFKAASNYENFKNIAYNITIIAGTRFAIGYQVSKETREKMSLAKKGKPLSEEHKTKIIQNLKIYRQNNPHPLKDKVSLNKGKRNKGVSVTSYTLKGIKLQTFKSTVEASLFYSGNESYCHNISRISKENCNNTCLNMYWRRSQEEYIKVKPFIYIYNEDKQLILISLSINTCSIELKKLGFKCNRGHLSKRFKIQDSFIYNNLFFSKSEF